MMPFDAKIFSVITTMLSPAVMISCCGVVILSLMPKLGRVVDRIRLLNQEKISIARKPDRMDTDRYRLKSIEDQIKMLLHRARLLKNSTGLILLGIFCFVITAVFLGVVFFFQGVSAILTVISFWAGMIFFLVGVAIAYWEIHISHYTIVEEIEVSNEVVRTLLDKQ
jgi:hypothetical protein